MAVRVLVVYANEPLGQTKDLALAIAEGAAGASNAEVRCLEATRADYKTDVHDWADAVVLGSGVYNGNAAPELLQFINSFDFTDDLSLKVGGSFATGAGVVAGLQPVLEQINRGLATFNFVVTGGSSWKNGEGTGIITNNGTKMSKEDLELARDEGLRIATLARAVRRPPPIPPSNATGSPPSWGERWAACVSANLTQLGYDAGLVIVNFTSVCGEDPRSQRSRTTYGDFYTVLTRCDLGLEFTIAPASRGGDCSVRTIGVDISERICGSCGCPFCVRDTNGSFFHYDASHGGITEWTEDASAEDVTIFRGTTKSLSTKDPFGLAVSIGYEPHTWTPVAVNVSHPMWVQTAAVIEGFSHEIDETLLEVPSKCLKAMAQ